MSRSAGSATPRAVGVAASGGRDSTALLHATARAGQALGVAVHALHVHHGLVDGADAWLAAVRAQARRWGCGFRTCRLEGAPARGESVEAWARRERYRALAAMAAEAGCTLVLLGQHRRDQAETVLLQALRGGGPAGLAAMSSRAERGGVVWARPWRDHPREAIEAYLRRHRLRWVEDPSNADARFARNRLRQQVWPALLQAFPDAEAQLAASARRSAEASAALDEWAHQDLQGCVDDTGGLVVAPWCGLSPARRALALRAWLAGQAGLYAGVPDSLVQRLQAELPGARGASRWPASGGFLTLRRGVLRLGR